jgi:hypothetical protein
MNADMPTCCSNVSGVNFNDILYQSNVSMSTKKSLKHQRGNQNTYIEEEQKTQRSKDKVQQKKQRSTKHTYKTKVLVTWIYLYLDVCSYFWLHTGPSLKSVGVSLSNDIWSVTCGIVVAMFLVYILMTFYFCSIC